MKPDIKKYNPDADYIRSLIDAIPMTQMKIAAAIGISFSTLQIYITHAKTHKPCPYVVQFALECLASESER